MKIGSLFSGIGGLELGLEAATGGKVVWQVEREAFPRSVLARHWPDADRSVTDVCDAGAHNLAPVDLICGGFPCQDISPAGKGAGITGAKSGLWSEYARLVRELRPRFVVVENSHLLPARGLGVVLGDLAALGYDAEWARIGARDVGAPHRRWRCFIVAWLADAHCQRREGIERPGFAAGPTQRSGAQRPEGADALPAPPVRQVADGVSAWMDGYAGPRAIAGSDLDRDSRKALRAYGNAVVPQVAYEVGLWLMRASAAPDPHPPVPRATTTKED